MNSRITLALSALHNITAFKLISALILAIATLNAPSACAMQKQWPIYKTTAAIPIQDGENIIHKVCSIVRALPEIPLSMLNEDAAQCAIVCNNLISNNPEFRALVLDHSVCLWQPGIPQTTTILGVGTSSGFGCPTLAVTSSRCHSPSKLFVTKSLCEDGRICEKCQDKDGWAFKKRIRAVRQDDGTVQCMPIEILYSNTKKNIHGRLALNTLCRMYRHNDNVADLNDQDIVTMASHYCNKVVTQIALLGVRKFRSGTLLNSCTAKDVLHIICGYIKRGTPEQVAADTRLGRRENLVQAPTAPADEEFSDPRDELGVVDCFVQ